ncbi:UNVERIFIED_CONTAM: hypothetical protein PYX00_011587 [Menopon gallinae]|uniref:Ribosomal protein L7Ae/L30e/S12e/Gadd45 domain-containing protein n=1 Tax=Menopon gallinae TaxID=328185 RepID=A0AAW2H810_9NEOP
MKHLVVSELHDIEVLDSERSRELCRLLECASAVLRTYNKIMAFAGCEENSGRLGALIVCTEDAGHHVVFQHLPLFCRHFGIRLLGLAKGSRAAAERAAGRIPAAIFGVLREDPVFEDVCRLAGPPAAGGSGHPPFGLLFASLLMLSAIRTTKRMAAVERANTLTSTRKAMLSELSMDLHMSARRNTTPSSVYFRKREAIATAGHNATMVWERENVKMFRIRTKPWLLLSRAHRTMLPAAASRATEAVIAEHTITDMTNAWRGETPSLRWSIDVKTSRIRKYMA